MPATALDDPKPHVRLKLSSLWASLMFCYIYGDYFGLYVPGKLAGMLAGHGPLGPVSQGSLVAVAIMLAIPGLMVFLTMVLPAVLARWLNISLSAFYIAIMIKTMTMSTWSFYLLLGAVEIGVGLLTLWYAWRWPRSSVA